MISNIEYYHSSTHVSLDFIGTTLLTPFILTLCSVIGLGIHSLNLYPELSLKKLSVDVLTHKYHKIIK